MCCSCILGKVNFQPLKLQQPQQRLQDEIKKTKKTSSCYKKLFNLPGDEKSDLVLTKIIEKIFPEKEDSVPNVQLAFVIVVCVTILNPKHASIRLDKVALKDKVENYLVSFCKFVNCDFVTSLFTKVSFS